MNYLQKELYDLIRTEDKIFDLIQDTSLDGLWYRDIENPENEWMNPKFWVTLGYNSSEIASKILKWQSVIHPDDLKLAIDQFIKHCKHSSRPYDQTIRYKHKNGSIVYLQCKGWGIRNKEGQVTRLLATHIDITKEKENEQKLKEALSSKGIALESKLKQADQASIEGDEAYRTLFNSIDEGYCVIQMIFDENSKPTDYRFLLINESFDKQTGMKDAVGKRMREFAPNHEDHWFETYGKIALTGESNRFENRAEQLGRWYDVYAFRFGPAENLQVAILFKDITERKQAEETIQLLNKELEHNLNEIEFVNKELESFSYSVSHDLRAPLRAIHGHANIIMEDFAESLNEETKRSIDIIRENSEKMATLIDDLLNFSKLGRKKIVRDHVNTKIIVKDIIDDICNQYKTKKTVFNVGDLHSTTGDIALLKQVWKNLISNAHKYSSKNDSPLIQIGSIKKDHEIEYYIKDNGVGFEMEYYDKLFGVFERLHGEDEFEGTGVGLAIVQRIVNRHEGKVWANAKINEGASFYFTIPIIES